MALAKIIPLFPRAPRPPGITCVKYIASAGTRCAYYLDNGACVRPDMFMCCEWLRLNAPPPPRRADVPSRDEALAHLRALRLGGAR